jgi:transposase
MKAYSVDLRRKIAETYETGGIAQRELAKRFLSELVFCHYSVAAVANRKELEARKRGASLKP